MRAGFTTKHPKRCLGTSPRHAVGAVGSDRVVATTVAQPDSYIRWTDTRKQVLGCNRQHGVNIKVLAQKAAQFRGSNRCFRTRVDGLERHNEVIASASKASAGAIAFGAGRCSAGERLAQDRFKALAAQTKVCQGDASGGRAIAAA